MKYTSPADFTDLIDYTEIYQNHYVTIPIQVRYGKNGLAPWAYPFPARSSAPEVRK
ncbi:MAG: hypothetical protein R2778_08090 [Saprospiraceae bacterium]